MDEIGRQRAYYSATALEYDAFHADETPALALGFLSGAIQALQIKSVLDVGSGTGRILQHLGQSVRAVGIEPVAALREVGYSRGIRRDALIEGDATNLKLSVNSFDLVCAFFMLHHVREPRRVVEEMLRVASKAILICDSNNFAQGRFRFAKQAINAFVLWPMANWIKTKGKGYTENAGDGIAYSYSVFNNYEQLSSRCASVHVLNLAGSGRNLYRSGLCSRGPDPRLQRGGT